MFSFSFEFSSRAKTEISLILVIKAQLTEDETQLVYSSAPTHTKIFSDDVFIFARVKVEVQLSLVKIYVG